MKVVLLLVLLLVILFMFSKNEYFVDENECSKIPEGECNSKLCLSDKCKIQHSENSKNCYCVERK